MAHLPFFEDAAIGRELQDLAAVGLDPTILDLHWAGGGFYVGEGNGEVWVDRGYTAIMAATSGGHAGLVKKLALLGANVNALSWVGFDALMVASFHGHVAVCSVLLDHGAVMTTTDFGGWTALYFSTLNAHLEVGLLLCSKGMLTSWQSITEGALHCRATAPTPIRALARRPKMSTKPLCSTASERAPTPRKSSAARPRTLLAACRSCW